MAITDISDRKKFLAQGNVYLPHIAVIEKIIDETPGVKTFHFNFKDEKLREEFTFDSGQFGEYSIRGSQGRADRRRLRPARPGAVTWNSLHRR